MYSSGRELQEVIKKLPLEKGMAEFCEKFENLSEQLSKWFPHSVYT